MSLGFHFLLLVFFSYLQREKGIPKQDKSLEIVFQDVQKDVRFVKAPENQKPLDKKPEKEVKFKSNRTQRAKLEIWKRPEKNIPLQSSISFSGQKGNNQKTSIHKDNKINHDNLFVTEKRKPLKIPGFGNSHRPPVPTFVQQRLPPGVRLGNITVLNTDQHRFYSFIQRLLSNFLPVWGLRVTKSLYKWIEENNAPVISKTWVTQVEVIMDEKGEILEVQPFRLSGLWSIDSATVESFKKIGSVPNPPKEMIDENGYIHLQFQTEVLWIPQPHLRFQGGQ